MDNLGYVNGSGAIDRIELTGITIKDDSIDEESSLIIEKEKDGNFRKLTISNCESLESALNFIKSSDLREELQHIENIFHVQFIINENFRELTQSELEVINQICAKISILLIFESENSKQICTFWSLKEMGHLLKLNPHKESFSGNDKNFFKFINKFLLDSLKTGHLGLISTHSRRSDASNIDVQSLADSGDHNLYFIASEQKNKEIQKYITQNIPKLNVKTENSFKRKFCIILITLCCLFAVFLGIVSLLGYLLYDPVYSFDSLSNRQQERVKNSFVNYNGVEVKLQELFANDTEVYNYLKSDEIAQMFNGQILNFATHLEYWNKFTEFEWNKLNKDLKLKVLNSKMSYHGENITMNDLYNNHKDAFESLSSDQIKYILNDKCLEIGSDIDYNGNFHISRDFIDDDIYAIFYKFKLNEKKHDEVNFQNFYENFISLDDYNLKISEIKSNLNFQEQFYSNFDSFFANLLNFNSFKFNETQIIEKTEQSRIFILSGETGVGKTSALEQIALIYKKKYPLKWISIIDLLEYKEELFNMSININNIQSTFEDILKLTSENEFERKIFEESYKSDEIVLIWDGFDEIFGEQRQILMDLMKDIYENTKNIQLIGTTLSASKLLTDAFNTSAHSIATFNELKVKQFLMDYFIFDHFYDEDYEDEVAEVHLNIDSILDILHDLSDNSIIQSDLLNPSILTILADLSVRNPLIYESKNYFEIYSKVISEKVKKWIVKYDHFQFYSDEVFDAQLLKTFQKFALKDKTLSMSNQLTQLYTKNLNVMSFNESSLISIEEYSKMGILNIKDKNNFKFVHKTFADFFVAQYIVESMENSRYLTLIIQLLLDILNSKPEDNRLIFKILESYFKSNNDLKQYESVFGVMKEKFSRTLFNSLRNGDLRPFKLLMPFLKINNNTLFNMLQINQDETLYTASFNPVYFNDLNGVKFNRSELKNIVTKSIDLNDDDYERFLSGKNQKGIILYGLYYFRENYGITLEYDDYGLDWVNDFESKREDLINLLISSNLTSDFVDKITSIASNITSNSGNITSNSGNLTSNSDNVTSKFTNLTSNSRNITSNFVYKITSNSSEITSISSNITSNSNNVTSNSGNLTSNSGNITSKFTNLTSNSSNITSNSSNITSNLNNITSNFVDKTLKLKRNVNFDDQTSGADNITSKFTNLTSNSRNITSNFVHKITSNSSEITSISSNITSNSNNLTSNSGNLTSNSGNITSKFTNLTSNSRNITSNSGNITSNSGNITSKFTKLTSNPSNITSNSSNITSNSGNVTSKFTNLTSNSSNITSNSSNITSNSRNITSNLNNITSNFVDKTLKLKRNADNITSKFTNLTSNSESYSSLTPTQVTTRALKLDPQSILKLVLSNLTKSEQKQLFLSETSPIIDEQIILRKYFWEKADEILLKDELKFLAVIILNRIHTFSNLRGENLSNLLHKLKEYLSDTEIIEVMTRDNILHKSATSSRIFKDLWEFYVSRTNEDQQDEILSNTIIGECFGDHIIGQKCYDTPPLNIFYIALIFGEDENIYKYVENIYISNNKAILSILNSNSVLPYSVMLCDKSKFNNFLSFIKKKFSGHFVIRKKILSFFYGYIGKTNQHINQYFDKTNQQITTNLKNMDRRRHPVIERILF